MKHPFLKSAALLVLLSASLTLCAQTQGVVIGSSSTPDPAAILWLDAQDQGLILPTTTDATGMTKKAGMVVYETTSSQVFYCDGTTWKAIAGGGTGSSALLKLAGNILSIDPAGAASISLASTAPGVTGQILMWDGVTSKWTSSAPTNPTIGSVLQWNGTQWTPVALSGGGDMLRANNLSDLTNFATARTNIGALGTTLNSGQLYVGNGSNVATSTSLGGDVSMVAGGNVTIGNSVISNAKLQNNSVNTGNIVDGTIGTLDLSNTLSISTTGDITTIGSGKLTVGGTTTFNARTYNWTGAAAAANTFLQNDGIGNLSWAAGMLNPLTTTGDIIFGTGAIPTRLAGAAGFLKSTGAAAPAWSAVNMASTDVTGVLAFANGGTGASAFAANAVPRSTGALLQAGTIFDNGTNVGIGGAPGASRLLVTTTTLNLAEQVTNTFVSGASNTGLRADASGSTSNNFGVFGNAFSGPTAYGLYGSASTATTSYGVNGLVTGAGVITAYGVSGVATSSGTTNYGIFGQASGGTTNWAGYFQGNAAITGGLAVGAAPNFGTLGQILTSAGPGIAPTWNTLAATISPINTVIRGNAAGTAQIASSIFDNGTYTGIGRSSPIGSSRMDIEATGGGVGGYGGLYVNTDASGWPFYGYATGGSSNTWTYLDGQTLTWKVYNSGDRLSIKNDGSVGINTTTPGAALHIKALNNSFTGAIRLEDDATADAGNILNGQEGLIYYAETAGNDHLFLTNTYSSVANPAMIVKDNGRIGVGTLSPATTFHMKQVNGFPTNGLTIENTTSASAWNEYVASTGDLWLVHNGTQRGQFDNISGAYSAVSDFRLKKNIVRLDNVMDDVLKLKPSRYQFKHDNAGGSHLGFIAQDVKELFPSMVQHNEENDTYILDYSGFGVLAIKAIQEQQEVIEKQKTEIEALRKDIEDIKRSIQELKNK